MTWLCLCMKWFSHIFSRSRFVHLQDAQYIYIYTETERHLMHLITNSWPQCKHMQGQRVKWLEQNLTSLKPTQTSALQLYSSVFWNKYDATLLLYELVCSMTQIWASFNMAHYSHYGTSILTEQGTTHPLTCCRRVCALGAPETVPRRDGGTTAPSAYRRQNVFGSMYVCLHMHDTCNG